jgi:molybdenum cofactor cytidylyltransferase
MRHRAQTTRARYSFRSSLSYPQSFAVRLDANLLDRLIEAFDPDRGNLIVVPVAEGRRGNPVLWSRRFFGELLTLDGDIGARHLVAKHAEAVAEVPVDGESAFLDIDTPQALETARR